MNLDAGHDEGLCIYAPTQPEPLSSESNDDDDDDDDGLREGCEKGRRSHFQEGVIEPLTRG